MGLFSAALLAAIRADATKAFGVLEITLGGATLSYADHDYQSNSGGYYAGRVTSWGTISRVVSDTRGGLTTPSATVVLDDTTDRGETLTAPATLRAFDFVVMGSYGRYLRDAPAVIKIGHKDVAQSDWCTWLTGRVTDCQKEGLSYRLSLELDTSWLDTPYGQELISTLDWPNAHPSAIGLIEPVRYGEIDATNAGGKGAVVCPNVDTSGFRYLFSRGVCKSGGPDRVYEDDVLTIKTYSRSLVVVNGKDYTLIDFTTDPGTAVVTADGYGLTSERTAGGTLISNPVSIALNYILNFVLQSHKAGVAYETTDSRIDATTWAAAATFATTFGLVGGASFEEEGNLRDLVTAGLNMFRLRGWFTAAGALAIGQWDHVQGTETADDIYPATRITQEDDIGGTFGVAFQRRVYSAVIAKWQMVRGRSGQQWEARDLSVVTPSFLPLDLSMTTDSGTQAEADGRTARYATAVALNEFRDQQMFASQVCPLWRGDTDLLTNVLWSHHNAPASGRTTGPGWSVAKDKARQMRITGTSLNLDTLTVSLTAQDTRWFLTSLWQVDRFVRPASAWEEGNARLDRGTVTTRSYTRASDAWIADPASGLVSLRATDSVMMTGETFFGPAGRVIERASLNYLKQCAGSTTGWSTTGTVVLEATDGTTAGSFWATSLVANCVKLGTAASTFFRTTATIPNQSIRFWGVVQGSSTAAILWRFQRASDSLYWRDSDSTWQVAATDNTWTGSTSVSFRKSKVIDMGGTGVASTVTILNTNGNFLKVFHLQVDTNPWASSPILTTTAEVTRAAGIQSISNNTGERTFPNTRGTLIVEGAPFWDTADDTAMQHTLVSVTHDASNWHRLYYDCSTGVLKFERRAAGTTVTATYTVDLVDRTLYGFAARWCSSEGELGLAPYTISVFFRDAAGVWAKGTDAIGAAIPTETASVNVRYGDTSGASNHQWDGALRQLWITPIVYTDEEIARRLGTG